MSDLTPPPEQPMDDATRARIRARLAESVEGPAGTGRFARWLVPVGAAAAVLVVALGVGYAALMSGDDGSAPPAAGTSSSTPSATPPGIGELPGAPTLEPSKPPTSPLIPPPARVEPDDEEGSPGPCTAAVAQQLSGASRVATWELPAGEAGIWVAGDRSVLCEDSGGIATAHHARPVEAPAVLGPGHLLFSSSTYSWDREQVVTAYVAGGPLPDGVTGIDYAFPDGHTEPARFRTDDAGHRWWVMAYVPAESELTGRDRNVLALDPVEVTVSLSGVQQQHRLQWGRDDCAQVNHGC